jgi:hypothetical protein
LGGCLLARGLRNNLYGHTTSPSGVAVDDHLQVVISLDPQLYQGANVFLLGTKL